MGAFCPGPLSATLEQLPQFAATAPFPLPNRGTREPFWSADLSGQWVDLVHGRRPPRGIVLDMDSSVSPTHGEQENSVWNGHYACTCYHPLFVFTVT